MFNKVFNNKKVIITGDTGFKGSWLAIWLLHLGAKVFGYSLPPKSNKDNYVITNLDKYIDHTDGDIRDYENLNKFFNKVKADFAFHLAAQPLVIDSYINPKYTFETNVIGTVNFLECLKHSKTIKVGIIVTSDKCYKNQGWIWGYRENDALGGDDPYSASKSSSEIIFNSYLKSFFNEIPSCNIASVRAGNVIGGGDWSEYRIVPDFFRALEKNEKLLIRNPYFTRPWQFVLEPLSGYLLLAEKLYSEGKDYQGSWNFGPLSFSNKTVKDLVDNIIGYIKKGKYILRENSNDYKESNYLHLDISKSTYYLKWYPVLNFEETVQMTVDGYISTNDNLLEERINQINKYYIIAKKKNILWTN